MNKNKGRKGIKAILIDSLITSLCWASVAGVGSWALIRVADAYDKTPDVVVVSTATHDIFFTE